MARFTAFYERIPATGLNFLKERWHSYERAERSKILYGSIAEDAKYPFTFSTAARRCPTESMMIARNLGQISSKNGRG